MSRELQPPVLSLSLVKIELPIVIKDEPPESEILETGIDDILDSLESEEEIISDVKDKDIVYHPVCDEFIKSEILESKHCEAVETQVLVKAENFPFIQADNITQRNKTSGETSDENVGKSTSQAVVEVQGSNEYSNVLGNLESDKQFVIYLSSDLNEFSTTNRKAKQPEKTIFAKCYKIVETTSWDKDKEKIKVIKAPVIPVEPHEYTSLAKDKHVCNHCQHAFNILSNLKIHIRKIHREVTTMYQCPYCSYKSKWGVRGHIISKHKDTKDIQWFQCNLCEMKFKFNSRLTQHMKVHLTHKPMQDRLDLKSELSFSCTQLQSKVPMVALEKIEHLTVIKNEPPEPEIVEIGMDDILDSSDEKSIEDIKDIEIVSHELSEDLIKSETVSENILENDHPESIETQIFVKTENNPFIETEIITQNENLNKTENTSDGNVNRGTGQGLIEVQGSIEHFNAFANQTAKQHESITLAKDKNACNKKHKARYCCKKCTYTSGRSSDLKLHQLTHKTKAEIDDRHLKYRCDKCKYKTFRHHNFKRHKLIHLKLEEIQYFYCYHCSYQCKQKSDLKKHIFRHFKNEDVKFHCYICDFVTLKRDLIIEHFKMHPKHHSKCDETEYKYQLPTCNKRYCCEKCIYTSEQSSNLKVHQLTHKTKAEIDDRLLKYRCDKCTYKTFRHHHFKRHKLIHLKPEEFQYFYCYHCSFKCKLKNNLKTHIFRHFKNKDVPVHCNICDFVTLKRDLINEHIKTHPKHHSAYDETEYKYQLETCNKRYCCEKCTYTSGKSSYFKLHQLIHKTKAEIDDRLLKYRCDKCKYKTLRHQNFKRHKLIHLKPEEIQYFYCYHCSFKCKLKNNLKTHIFRHFKNEDVPFHCNICDFVTLKRDLINEHIKTHPKHHSK